MLGKDIEKEGFIKFTNKKQREKNYSKEEYNEMINHAYINQLKYNKGNIDPLLKEKYENLKFRIKTINTIKNISIIQNTILKRRLHSKKYNDFIAIEDKNGLCLLYNITTGEDHSFDSNKELEIIKNKTNIKTLYNYNIEDYQDVLSIGYIDKITLYKNSEIINNLSNTLITDSDFLEFKDTLGNTFYLDVLFNNIYARKNSYKIKENRKTKKIIIFEKNKEKKLNIKFFNNTFFNFLKLFYNFE